MYRKKILMQRRIYVEDNKRKQYLILKKGDKHFFTLTRRQPTVTMSLTNSFNLKTMRKSPLWSRMMLEYIYMVSPGGRKMELAECLNMEVEESATPSEDSLEVITTTRQTFSSKHSNHVQIAPSKKTRNRKSKFISKLRRRSRKLDSQRSPYLFCIRGINRNALQKQISLNKGTTSDSSLQCLVPDRSVSRILVTEETICMGASSQEDESSMRRSLYRRRVSSVHIECETTESDHKKGENPKLSKAYQRLLKPRKKSVRLQTLPEPDPSPPPSLTGSEKEADLLRRSEMFKRSRAYQRLMAPRRLNKGINTDNKAAACPPPKKRGGPAVAATDEPFGGDSDKTPLIAATHPSQTQSRQLKLANFKRENLNGYLVSAKTMALVERAASSAKKRKKSLQARMTRRSKVFDRLTAPRSTHVFALSTARPPTNQHQAQRSSPEFNAVATVTTYDKAIAEASTTSVALSESAEKAAKCCTSKVFDRLIALKKRKDSPWEKMCLLKETSDTTLSSEEEKINREMEFRSSPSFQRLTAVPKTSDRRDNVGSTSKKDLREDGTSQETIPPCDEYEKQFCEKHYTVVQRLLAPRKEAKGSEWSRETSVKASFALHKFRSVLNKSLFEYAVSIPPKEEEVSTEPSRESSAFRRLLAPRLRSHGRQPTRRRRTMRNYFRRCGPSSSSEKLISDDWGTGTTGTPPLHESSATEDPPPPPRRCRRHRSDMETLVAVTTTTETPTSASSERGERFTDASFETVSVSSQASSSSEDDSAVVSELLEDNDRAPLLGGDAHPSWEARAECYDILREISALRRKMAKQITKMTSEIYETPCRRYQHDLWSKRSHVTNVWNPLGPLRSLDEWRLRSPRHKPLNALLPHEIK